jgi:hypothetical protein
VFAKASLVSSVCFEYPEVYSTGQARAEQTNLRGELRTSHVRHDEIGHHQIERLFASLQQVQGLYTVARLQHAIALCRQGTHDDLRTLYPGSEPASSTAERLQTDSY